MPTLRLRGPVFYSHLDEEVFFAALKGMSSVRKVEGQGSDLLLSVPTRLPNQALRELLGLFFRYKIEMGQLAQFLTKGNRSWFHDPKGYWFKKVFSSRPWKARSAKSIAPVKLI